jgi:hypothetical protein
VNIEIPAVLRFEHAELQEELAKAMKVGGKTGEAARVVLEVLLPHLEREKTFAAPPLSLLPLLASGQVTPEMASVLSLTDTLKAEFPEMLAEHRVIVVALRNLMRAATEEKQAGYARFAQKLILHAQMEEEVLYPAAILVGEFVKCKLGWT